MSYDNTNTGVLFRAKTQETEKHPTHNGSLVEIVCPHCKGKSDFWLAAWVKVSKAGEKFFKLAVKPKDAPKESKPVKQGNFDDMKDDIPW